MFCKECKKFSLFTYNKYVSEESVRAGIVNARPTFRIFVDIRYAEIADNSFKKWTQNGQRC